MDLLRLPPILTLRELWVSETALVIYSGNGA